MGDPSQRTALRKGTYSGRNLSKVLSNRKLIPSWSTHTLCFFPFCKGFLLTWTVVVAMHLVSINLFICLFICWHKCLVVQSCYGLFSVGFFFFLYYLIISHLRECHRYVEGTNFWKLRYVFGNQDGHLGIIKVRLSFFFSLVLLSPFLPTYLQFVVNHTV